MADIVKRTGGRLARRTSSNRGPVREFLAFALGSDLYGVELRRIREILSPPPMTPVPRAPHTVLGVCSVRGLLVTVVDLRRCLKLAEGAPGRRARILLTEAGSGEVVGLFVDEVRQVMRLSENEIEVATSVLGGDASEHVLGIGRSQGEMLILLDIAGVVAS